MTTGDPTLPPDPFEQNPEQIQAFLTDGGNLFFAEDIAKKEKGAAVMRTSLLRQGDILAMQYERGDGTNGGYTFALEATEWTDLGDAGDPQLLLVGKVEGAELPMEFPRNQEARFVGLSAGGMSVRTGVISTGFEPVFKFEKSEIHMPAVTNFEVFREDENGHMHSLEPQQLTAEAHHGNPVHRERMNHIERLMQNFGLGGFDFENTRTRQPADPDNVTARPSYDKRAFLKETDRYIVNYNAGLATGNRLQIFDKTTQQQIDATYYNYDGEDFLKVTFRDLEGVSEEEARPFRSLDPLLLSSRVTGEEGKDVARITYTSSSANDLDVVNYLPAHQDAKNLLELPPYSYEPYHSARTDLQLYPDGSVNVHAAALYYPDEYEKRYEAVEKIRDRVSQTKMPDGSISLQLGSEERVLPSIDAVLTEILKHSEIAQATKRHHAGRIGKVARRAFQRKPHA